MKLVVNTVMGLGMQSVGEGIALGLTVGLPRDVLFETLAKTAVVSPVQDAKLASARVQDTNTRQRSPKEARRLDRNYPPCS